MHTLTAPPENPPRRHRSDDGVPLLLGFSEILAGRTDVVGARAARLSYAACSRLPVPAGSVLTPAALGCVDSDERGPSATSDEIAAAFIDIGHGGDFALTVKVSAVATSDCSADKCAASFGATDHAELLRIIRGLSVTASLLGDMIAVVIQRDVEPTTSGRLIASRSDRRLVASIAQQAQVVGPDRLVELGHHISSVFSGDRWVKWSIDRYDRLWILEIGSRIGC